MRLPNFLGLVCQEPWSVVQQTQKQRHVYKTPVYRYLSQKQRYVYTFGKETYTET